MTTFVRRFLRRPASQQPERLNTDLLAFLAG